MNYDNQCPKCHGELEKDGTCSCGYGAPNRGSKAQAEKVDQTCPCGCGRAGDIKQDGVWRCWESAGYTRPRAIPEATGNGNSYRERWYRERGLPYEPPRLPKAAGSLKPLAADFKPAGRMREPGED